jgi:hypothetical protein
MGLPDTYDIMWQCDRWLLLGAPSTIPNQLYKAIEEQQWEHREFLTELLQQWMEWTHTQANLKESASFHRGYGWRVWYPIGTPLDSLAQAWKEIPPGLAGGVVYLGPIRRILQGKDPFFLEHGLPRACHVANELPTQRDEASTFPKMGTWVTDEQMATFRKAAIFAFGLE